MPDRREGEDDRKKKIPAYAYIGVPEYRRRLAIIQETIHSCLALNDQRFGGDDGIEGALVYGSYAKSFTIAEGKTLVHNLTSKTLASDLDLAYFRKSAKPPQLTELNEEDYQITGLEPLQYIPQLKSYIELIKSPGWRLDALIKYHLGRRAVFAEPNHMSYLLFEYPENVVTDLAEGYGSIINGQGLVFINPNSIHRTKIINTLRRARLPMVLDPATTAEVLSPSTSP
jgi:hypothetical protein